MLITKCIRSGSSSVITNPIHQFGKNVANIFRLFLLHKYLRTVCSPNQTGVNAARLMAIKAFSIEQQQQSTETRKAVVPSECRFVYPEFLPDPKIEWRNLVKEKLERSDMLNRR